MPLKYAPPPIGRRDFLQGIGAATLTTLLSSCMPAGEGKALKKNVLFISIDDLKPLLGCYGNPHVHSPNIDKLAARGVTFTNCHCQYPTCGPSRNSLLSGRRVDAINCFFVNDHYRDALPEQVSLPQHFKRNGYFTHSIGKVFHHRFDREKGHTTVACPDEPYSWTGPAEFPIGQRYALPENQAWCERLREAGETMWYNSATVESADVHDDVYDDGLAARRAEEVLAGLGASDQPFFLGVGFQRPHLPFVAPRKYWDLYDPELLPLADNRFLPKELSEAGTYSLGNELSHYAETIPALEAAAKSEDGRLPDDVARRLTHGYYACVSYVDALVGRLIEAVRQAGLEDNTVICLWGDHGFHLGENLHWAKHVLMEQSTWSPLILVTPEGRQNTDRVEEPSELLDVYPTLAELCGLRIPDSLEGRSWAGALGGGVAAPVGGEAITVYRGGEYKGYALRDPRYRLILWFDRQTGEEAGFDLFDHDKDPQENVSLRLDPAYASVRESLRSRLLAHIAEQTGQEVV